MLAGCNQAFADTTVNYSIGGGRTSNIFKDTTRLPASFAEGKLALRGGLDLEDSQFAYALTASARRVPRFHFVDERAAGVEAGFTRELGEIAKLTLKGGIEHRRSGDLFLSLPGLLIGYRQADLLANASAGLTAEHAGGKSHVTASVASFDPEKVKFTLQGLPRVQLEGGSRLYELTGGHIRPLLGGEIGATLQYRTNRIPSEAQDNFERFPARTLRGSIAFGRDFGDVTLLAEAGIVAVHGRDLGQSVDPTRPFLKTELAWQVLERTVFKAKLSRDIQLTDIDDPLGEDVRTVGASLETGLTEKLKLGLAFEQAYSDWLYYDYRTRTSSITATLSYTLAEGATAALEYSHLVRRETDEAADFKVDGLVARFSGSF